MKKIIFLLIVVAGNKLTFSQNLPVIFPYAHMASAMAVDSKDNLIVTVTGANTGLWRIAPDGKTSIIIENFDKVKTSNSAWLQGTVLAVDKNDNIYMGARNMIWKVTPNGAVRLFAGERYKDAMVDGNLATAQFSYIDLMKIDPLGNIIILEKHVDGKDTIGHYFVLRKISTDGIVTTLTDTRHYPNFKSGYVPGMGVDAVGNIYLSDGAGRCIKKVAPDGNVTTVAGICNKRKFKPLYIQGDISNAELMSPDDIVINKKGEIIFSDERLHRIIKIADKKVTTIAGSGAILSNSLNIGGIAQKGNKDGKAMAAMFNFPEGCNMVIDSKDNIYILETGNYAIRKLSADGNVSTFAHRIKD